MKKTAIVCIVALNCLAAHADDTLSSGRITAQKTDSIVKTETPVTIQEAINSKMNQNPNPEGGGITIGAGIYNQTFDDFNKILTSHGINALNRTLTTFNLGFFGLVNPQNRVGLDFDFLWSEKAGSVSDSSPIGSVDMNGYAIGFKWGHDLTNSPAWGLMPVFQIGYYSHTYNFTPRLRTLDDILVKSAPQQVQLKYSGMSLTTGLNIHAQTITGKGKITNGKLHKEVMGYNLEAGVHYYPIRVLNTAIDNGLPMSRYGLYAKVYLFLGEDVAVAASKEKE